MSQTASAIRQLVTENLLLPLQDDDGTEVAAPDTTMMGSYEGRRSASSGAAANASAEVPIFPQL